MNIFKAVRASMSQDFGENKPCCVTENGTPLRPFKLVDPLTDNTCPINSMKFYEAIGMKGHNGRDWRANFENVYYPCEWTGRIKYDNDADGGLGVDVVSEIAWLRCTEGCPAGTLHHVKYRAWHLSQRPIPAGTIVSMGDLIAISGNTGASTGPHLHDAAKWCDENGNGIHTDNGFFGAIGSHPDITFDPVFVLDAKKTLSIIAVQITAVGAAIALIAKLLGYYN